MDWLDKTALKTAQVMAFLGGLVLLAMIAITVISVAGRALIAFGLGPIAGDFELIEAGTAFAVFCFLPLCQIRRGHAAVDVLARNFGPLYNRILDGVIDAAFLLMALLMAWRLWAGTQDKLAYGETSFILQFPLWWAYGASFLASLSVVVIAFYCLWASIQGRHYD